MCFLLLSCRSIPPRGSFAGATVIGEDSDVFLFIPVQYNKSLLTKILSNNKYVKKAIDKTDFLYLSLALKDLKQVENDTDSIQETYIEDEIESETEGMLQDTEKMKKSKEKVASEKPENIKENAEKNPFDMVSYDVCAVGSYPTKLTRFFLTKKNGWTRKKRRRRLYILPKRKYASKIFFIFLNSD